MSPQGDSRDTRHLETVAVHAGRVADSATGAVMPPIHLSTTFERNADGTYTDGFVYTRSENPNRRALEALSGRIGGRCGGGGLCVGPSRDHERAAGAGRGRPCDRAGRHLLRYAQTGARAIRALGLAGDYRRYDGSGASACGAAPQHAADLGGDALQPFAQDYRYCRGGRDCPRCRCALVWWTIPGRRRWGNARCCWAQTW